MRNLFFALIAISVVTLQGCNGKNTRVPSAQAGTPEIMFREYEHAFGKVKEGEKVSWQFLFDNKGPGDLVITGVSTTCGCTVTKYDTKPIAPGGSGTIEAVFDTSDRSGMQTKTITVKSNATKPVILLKITAEVESGN